MAARAIWTGTINFGLVNIPVKLYAATQENDISFHQAHVHGDGREIGRIQYKKTCTVCQEVVPYEEIAKGYETEAGTVILTKEDIAAIPLDTIATIEVQEFVPAHTVPAILFEKVYTLTPEVPKKAQGKPAGAKLTKAYGMLAQALAGSGKVGIVKVTLRQREQLAMLSVRNGRMEITTLRWADEVREMPEANYPVSDETEVAVAAMFIESLSNETFEPSSYQDGYRVALEAVIASKEAGLVPEAPKVEEPDTSALDLMAALRESVERNRAKRQARELVAA